MSRIGCVRDDALQELRCSVWLAVSPSPERPLTDCLDDVCTSAAPTVADGRSAELHNTVTNRDVPIYTKCSVYQRRTKASGTYRLYRAYAKPSDMTH